MSPVNTILVVDDDPMSSAWTRMHLAQSGYEVFEVHSGREAIEWLAAQTPALVILDVVMPGMSGLEVCRWIRQNEKTRQIPVIFLTYKDRLQEILQGREAGSDLYLVKPVPRNRLLTLVEMFLPKDGPPIKKTPPQGTQPN
jgi:DNA-binding response OmpR family regulator